MFSFPPLEELRKNNNKVIWKWNHNECWKPRKSQKALRNLRKIQPQISLVVKYMFINRIFKVSKPVNFHIFHIWLEHDVSITRNLSIEQSKSSPRINAVYKMQLINRDYKAGIRIIGSSALISNKQIDKFENHQLSRGRRTVIFIQWTVNIP